jgi:hypothetical protein
MKFIQYAQESIQFQSDEFARALISQCGKILTFKSGRDAQTSKEVKELDKLIFDSTGILAKLHFDTTKPPCVNIPFLNPNNILHQDLINDFVSASYDEVIKLLEKPNMDAFIDLKKSRIGGYYSTIKFDIYAGFKFLSGLKFTAEELAAVILHELGHAFVLFEMLDRSVRTNQILAATVKASSDNPTGDLLKQRIVMIGTKSKFTDEQITALQNASSPAARQVLVLSYRNNEPIRNDLGSTNYHHTTYEALADNFVARHNLGRHLVSALERISIHFGLPEYHKSIRIILGVIDISNTMIMIAGGIFFLATGGLSNILTGVFLLGMFGITILASGDNHRDFTYDDLDVRYKRIREQTIVYLKNKQLDAEEIKRCLDDLEFFDSALKKVGSSQGVITKIANMVLPGARKESKAIELQRDLEALAANDLFAKAATLSLLK